MHQTEAGEGSFFRFYRSLLENMRITAEMKNILVESFFPSGISSLFFNGYIFCHLFTIDGIYTDAVCRSVNTYSTPKFLHIKEVIISFPQKRVTTEASFGCKQKENPLIYIFLLYNPTTFPFGQILPNYIRNSLDTYHK
jgi:hypothetical protein